MLRRPLPTRPRDEAASPKQSPSPNLGLSSLSRRRSAVGHQRFKRKSLLLLSRPSEDAVRSLYLTCSSMRRRRLRSAWADPRRRLSKSLLLRSRDAQVVPARRTHRSRMRLRPQSAAAAPARLRMPQLISTASQAHRALRSRVPSLSPEPQRLPLPLNASTRIYARSCERAFRPRRRQCPWHNQRSALADQPRP